MTTFFLVRHAAHALLDQILVGRMPGVCLSEKGFAQAASIADRLFTSQITTLHSSPRLRARETAAHIARRTGLPVEISSAIDEIDFGDWSGMPFDALRRDPLWAVWNRARSSVRPPRGETMRELQARVMRHLHDTSAREPEGRIVFVSHAEVIRAAIMQALRLELDDYHRVEIGPATISTLKIGPKGTEIIALNEAVP